MRKANTSAMTAAAEMRRSRLTFPRETRMTNSAAAAAERKAHTA